MLPHGLGSLVCLIVVLSWFAESLVPSHSFSLQTDNVGRRSVRSSSFPFVDPRLHSVMTEGEERERTSKHKLKVLGVGGGIGSGKSTACKLLVSDFDCAGHIDADSVAHTVYRSGSKAVQDVANAFGPDIVQSNGEIDRKKLGAIVFADRSQMRRLEEIVWPHTRTEVLRLVEEIRDAHEDSSSSNAQPVVVVEAAMLLDAGWQDFLDGVWVVTASRDVALQRLMDNRGWSREEAEQRLEAQTSRRGVGNLDEEVAASRVSAVVDNSGTLESLKEGLAQTLNNPKAWY